MAGSISKMCRRLQDLETRLIPRECPSCVFVMQPVDPRRRENLAQGERIVMDYFRHDGQLISAAERITTDPADAGRRCEPGGHLRDVIESLHRDCYWREKYGVCRICKHTPVANT